MKKQALPAIMALALAACETTGDPNQGGLFGWSETKAKGRIAEKEEALAHRRGELERERAKTARLHRTMEAGRQPPPSPPKIAAPRKDEFAAATAEASQIERQAPTASGASRARRLRDEIETLRVDPTLSPDEKIARLRLLRADLKRLRASLNLSP